MLGVKNMEVADASIKKNCTLVFLADLHIPLSRTMERKLIANLEKIKPDFILIGGDFSSYRAKAPLSIEKINLLSRYGKVIMVMGNTDQCGSRQCMYCFLRYSVDRLDSLPARILRNEKLELPETGITVYGLDDPVTKKDDTSILRSMDTSRFNILLVHSIYKVSDRQKQRFNLICSGHTHGGQIFFLKPFLHLFDPAIDSRYISGRYGIGKTDLIVSNGIGMSFQPFRLGVPPDIWVFHLTSIP
jgi:predicted MPP superfamily phosphohydrolase